MDFLNGLAQRTNYANIMAQKNAQAEANKQAELSAAMNLNAAKERDTQNALNYLQMQDKAEQDLAAIPLLESDRKKLADKETQIRDEVLAPLVKKYNGNVLDLLKSYEGKAATLKYINSIKNHPELQTYKRNAAIMAENEKRVAMGMEPIAVFRPETKKWYTPEQQLEAKEAGELPNLEPHPYVKQNDFSAAKYFQNLLPPTDKMDEYYKKEGRMAVSPDDYALGIMENKYSSFPVNTPVYNEYYRAAKEFYNNHSPLYYKMPENKEELARVREEMSLRGYQNRMAIKKAFDDMNEPSEEGDVTEHIVTSIVPVKKDGTTVKTPVELKGAEFSPSVLKSDVNATSTHFYTPSNRRYANNSDTDVPNGTEIIEEGKDYQNAAVVIPKAFKVVYLPTDAKGVPSPNPYSSGSYRIFVTATSGEGGDKKIGYVPYATAEPILRKLGWNYDKLKAKLSKGVQPVEEVQQTTVTTPATPTAPPTTTTTTTTTASGLPIFKK